MKHSPIPNERQTQMLTMLRWRAIEADPSLLHLLLEVDFETGALSWRPRHPSICSAGNTSRDAMAATWNKQFAGKPAFTALNKGYRCGRLFDRMFQAHRVVYAMRHGEWPEQVDHIDGNPSNNAIHNLRSVSALENGHNQRKKKNNTSGITGVSWSSRLGAWTAHIRVNRKSVYLGRFNELSGARDARWAAEVKYGFHENHGLER